MIKQPRTVRAIAQEIEDSALRAFESYRSGDTCEEPQITDRIFGAIQEGLHHKPVGGLIWKARTLRTGRGKAAEEKRHGADILGVLDISTSEYNVKKGFLAQAKRAEPSVQFSSKDWNRLKEQCEVMLERTPDSFVLIYSKEKGIRFFPANSVIGLKSRNIFDLYDRSVASFFELHLECFIGDRRLHSTDIKTLDTLLDFHVERVFELSAREAD